MRRQNAIRYMLLGGIVLAGSIDTGCQGSYDHKEQYSQVQQALSCAPGVFTHGCTYEQQNETCYFDGKPLVCANCIWWDQAALTKSGGHIPDNSKCQPSEAGAGGTSTGGTGGNQDASAGSGGTSVGGTGGTSTGGTGGTDQDAAAGSAGTGGTVCSCTPGTKFGPCEGDGWQYCLADCINLTACLHTGAGGSGGSSTGGAAGSGAGGTTTGGNAGAATGGTAGVGGTSTGGSSGTGGTATGGSAGAAGALTGGSGGTAGTGGTSTGGTAGQAGVAGSAGSSTGGTNAGGAGGTTTGGSAGAAGALTGGSGGTSAGGSAGAAGTGGTSGDCKGGQECATYSFPPDYSCKETLPQEPGSDAGLEVVTFGCVCGWVMSIDAIPYMVCQDGGAGGSGGTGGTSSTGGSAGAAGALTGGAGGTTAGGSGGTSTGGTAGNAGSSTGGTSAGGAGGSGGVLPDAGSSLKNPEFLTDPCVDADRAISPTTLPAIGLWLQYQAPIKLPDTLLGEYDWTNYTTPGYTDTKWQIRTATSSTAATSIFALLINTPGLSYDRWFMVKQIDPLSTQDCLFYNSDGYYCNYSPDATQTGTLFCSGTWTLWLDNVQVTTYTDAAGVTPALPFVKTFTFKDGNWAPKIGVRLPLAT
ncbi:MAG: hypothetical protein WCW31_00210 [Patescibacteria group bacterium]